MVGKAYVAAFDPKGHALDDGPRRGAPGGAENSSESLAGHAHALGRRALIQAFEIGKAQGLVAVESQMNFLERVHWDAARLEIDDAGQGGDAPALARPGHGGSLQVMIK